MFNTATRPEPGLSRFRRIAALRVSSLTILILAPFPPCCLGQLELCSSGSSDRNITWLLSACILGSWPRIPGRILRVSCDTRTSSARCDGSPRGALKRGFGAPSLPPSSCLLGARPTVGVVRLTGVDCRPPELPASHESSVPCPALLGGSIIDFEFSYCGTPYIPLLRSSGVLTVAGLCGVQTVSQAMPVINTGRHPFAPRLLVTDIHHAHTDFHSVAWAICTCKKY